MPAARLKYAMALLKLPEDKKGEALKYLQSVIKDFPQSQEAKTAKDYITKLTPAPAKPAAPVKTPAKKAPPKKG